MSEPDATKRAHNRWLDFPFTIWRIILKVHHITIADIYVPVSLRKTLKTETAEAMADDILENGMNMPIQVRHDGKRIILIAGIHRIEAAKLLGETVIDAFLVQARRH